MLRFVECRNENNSGWIEPVARDWTHRFEPHVSADGRAIRERFPPGPERRVAAVALADLRLQREGTGRSRLSSPTARLTASDPCATLSLLQRSHSERLKRSLG
jgi:hypothetical protein